MPTLTTPDRAPAATLRGMTPKEIGALVKAKRIEQGLSYRDLAELCGLDRTTTVPIRKVEAGEEYKLSTLATVCKVLGLEIVVQATPKKVTKR